MLSHEALGVGFLGAGPVTQAIHVPALARLTDTFRIVHVSDVSAAVAAAVADRVGARSSTTAAELLNDPQVDVVAVCSPHRFHADQVIAACRAGKKAVLCEKPFAMSGAEAEEIAAVSLETGVPVVVGAMHMFDPGWRSVASHWNDLPENSHTVRSSIVLPPNPRFEDFATEVIARPGRPAVDVTDPDVQAAMVHGGVMGLAIHDLPLVRMMLSDFSDLTVLAAHHLPPFGYQIVLTVAGKRVELHAATTATWQPQWELEVYSDTAALHVEFPPSYVNAGSAVATLRAGEAAQTWGPAAYNGYEGEWREIAAVARHETPPPSPASLVDDLRFALAVADAAAGMIRAGHQGGIAA